MGAWKDFLLTADKREQTQTILLATDPHRLTLTFSSADNGRAKKCQSLRDDIN
jgi:hypothetical protein